jgi:hypothetical protein
LLLFCSACQKFVKYTVSIKEFSVDFVKYIKVISPLQMILQDLSKDFFNLSALRFSVLVSRTTFTFNHHPPPPPPTPHSLQWIFQMIISITSSYLHPSTVSFRHHSLFSIRRVCIHHFGLPRIFFSFTRTQIPQLEEFFLHFRIYYHTWIFLHLQFFIYSFHALTLHYL